MNEKLGVMRGLAPRIHDELQRTGALQTLLLLQVIMDCRVKPGNDHLPLSGLLPVMTFPVMTRTNPAMTGNRLLDFNPI